MRRKWLVIVAMALLGAAGGAYLGDRAAPGEVGVLVSVAVFGFGLGGLLGVFVSGWWRPPPKPPAPAPAIQETEFTARAEPEPPESEAQPEPEPEPEHAAALVEHAPPPPPPDDDAPGWYTDHEGVRRYWDGDRWTEIVWRERQARTRKR